ncbi:MAG: undecaprenyl-diphosphate phosphatase [Promethearchaeota archaeon]|nr:MAG: undecaprenyl-diphosphate phosphatase [Candidatus Lokiarchaeota archaeon]
MIFEYIIIAILQGFLEWLPISSSGQTFIVSMNIFGLSAVEAYSLSIWLHLGTTLAVLLKFRMDFIKIIKSFMPRAYGVDEIDVRKRNWLIYATLGTGITALPLYFIFRIIIADSFTSFQGDLITLIVCGLLVITGIILLKTRKIYGEDTLNEVAQNSITKDSFLSGLIQGVSILPGISRSGVTVSTILLENYNQDNALRLSFLMSVPVAIASIIVDIIFSEGSIFGIINPLIIVIVTLISFFVGYLSMEFLLRVAQKISFGYFCILYGVVAYLIIIPFMLIP